MHKYAKLHSVGLIWGSQFFLISIILGELDSDSLAFYRSLIGAMTLIIASLFIKRRIHLYNRKDLIFLFSLSLTNVTFPFLLLAKGQQDADANVAAILMAFIPIFTLIMSIMFLKEKKKKFTQLSFIMGFIGIISLIGLENIINANHVIFSELLILSAALCFAAAVIFSKKLEHVSSLILSRDVMIIGTLSLGLILIFSGATFNIYDQHSIFLPLLILGIFPSGLVYIIFFQLVNDSTASFASLTNYLVPVYGVLFSILFLELTIQMNMVYALFFIFLSIYLSQKK